MLGVQHGSPHRRGQSASSKLSRTPVRRAYLVRDVLVVGVCERGTTRSCLRVKSNKQDPRARRANLKHHDLNEQMRRSADNKILTGQHFLKRIFSYPPPSLSRNVISWQIPYRRTPLHDKNCRTVTVSRSDGSGRVSRVCEHDSRVFHNLIYIMVPVSCAILDDVCALSLQLAPQKRSSEASRRVRSSRPATLMKPIKTLNIQNARTRFACRSSL